MKKYISAVSTLIFSLLLNGCFPSTGEIIAAHELGVSTGTETAALPLLNEAAQRNNCDQLLWYLMLGTSCSLSGNPAESIRYFDLAEDIFSANDRQSVFGQSANTALAMIQNETCFNFNGNGQDRLFCCFYKALNYAAAGNTDAARTELNRAMEHQENWLYARRKELAEAAETMEKNLAEQQEQSSGETTPASLEEISADPGLLELLRQHCSFDMQKNGDIGKLTPADYQNAYITHFCGIFRRLNGDGGREYLHDAAKLNPENPVVAADLAAADASQKTENMVWLYLEDGLSPDRLEVRLDLPFALIPYANRYVLYAGLAFPALHYRESAVEKYTVTADGKTIELTELENIDRLLKVEYDVYMYGAVKREIARCLLKTASQAALGIAAENTNDSTARSILRASQIAAAAHAAATTKADLRSWRSLPKKVYLQQFPRPADGTVTINAGTDSLTLTLEPGNNIIWLRKAAFTAPIRQKILCFK